MVTAFASLGPSELLIVFAIIVLLFGASRLPSLARSLGRAQREFQEGTRQLDHNDQPA